jgi:hypothetical protein
MPNFVDHLDKAAEYESDDNLRACYRELLKARRQTTDHNELYSIARWMESVDKRMEEQEPTQ